MNKLVQKYLRPSQIPTKACHGCGIGMIENWILQALDDLELTQEDVIFGTGIGCVGRQTYATWGGDNFGATHGRVLSVATGLKLAQPDKKYLIVVGDGDAASIGTSHLIHAARRNLGVTVVCEDNMGYESTGGQFSPTTPAGYVTNSSPYGMVEPPYDPCDVVKAAGATFVAETTATQWTQTIKIVKKALQNDGFSFVHVRFPCNENFGAYALGTRDTLKNLEWIDEHTRGRKADGSAADFVWDTGIKHDASNSRPEFSKLMRDLNHRIRTEMAAKQAAAAGGNGHGGQ
jgi:2-oxoglutarate ferredoxin oxidoreductase subunit beta